MKKEKEPKNKEQKKYNASQVVVKVIALILTITTIFCYDEFIKFSNNKGFLLQTI